MSFPVDRALRARRTFVLAALLAGLARPAAARTQDTTAYPGAVEFAAADRAPQFYYAPAPARVAERRDARNATVLHRRLALDLKGATIAAALAEIGRAAGIAFVYSRDLVRSAEPVTFRAEGITVLAALTEVLAETNCDVEVGYDGHLALVRQPAAPAPSHIPAQARELHGHVTEAGTGSPLGEAQIQIKGTTIGAISRDDGDFTIASAPAQALTLVIRRIGYKQVEHAVGADENNVQIALEPDVLHLEQTIITGQATVVKKENVANDVAVVDATQLGQVQAPEVLSDLEGKVAGANIQANSGAPGGGLQIQLRGISSLIGTSDPLFVVDGVIISNVTIQPGTQLISEAQETNSIASNEDNGTNRLSDLDPSDIATIEVLKGASAAAIYGSQAANGVVVITTKQGHVGRPEIRIGQKFGFSAISNEIGERNFTSDTAAADAFGANGAALWQPGVFYNHETELAGYTPLSYATNLSVSGGSENTQYYISGLNEHDGGIIQNTYYNKQAANVKVNQSLSKQLQFQAGLQLLHNGDGRSFTGNDNIGAALYDGLSFTPSFVNLMPNANGVYPTNPFGTSNVLQTAALYRNEEVINRGIGSLSGTWHILSTGVNALNLLATTGADYFQQQNNVYSPPSLQYEIFFGNPGESVLAMANNLQTNVNINLVDLVTPASGAFTSTTSLGFQQNTRYLNSDYTYAKNLTGDLQNINTGTIVNVDQDRENVVDQGLFAQEEFLTLHERLMLTAGLRADRSTDDANPATLYYYPKGSASYRVPGSWAFVNSLKLRAAVGESGNEPLYGQKFGELAVVNYSGFSGAQTSGTVASPNLQPERQLEFEGGFDLTLFDSVMTVSVTGYQKNISQLLLERALPLQSGYSTEFFNGGDMRTRGLELEVSAAPVQQQRTQWTITATFSKIGEVVTSLPVPPFTPAGGFGVGAGGAYITPGTDPATIWGSCLAVKTDIIGICQIGTANPDFRVGLGNDINIHRFHIYFNWDWQKGTNISNRTQLYYDFSDNAPDASKIVNCPPRDGGTGAPISIMSCRVLGLSDNTGAWVDDGAFIKLRELTIAYNLPVSLLRPLGRSFTSASIQVEGRNLVDFNHYPGLDPEVSVVSGNINTGRNIDVTPFPPSRTFWFGLNLGL